MSKKTITPLIVLGSVAAGALVYQSCQKPKKSQNIKKIKKWIDWEIEFKENTSDLEKAKAINGIEKHLLDHLYNQEMPIFFIQSIVFSVTSHNNDERIHLSININLDATAIRVIQGPPPQGPPPIRELFDKMPASIQNIKNMANAN